MLSAAELRAKWFIDVASTTGYPPQVRHAGSAVSAWTEGNQVTAIRDGQDFMGQWASSIDQMRTGATPAQCAIWLAGWRLEGVETRGIDHPDSDALDMLEAARDAGIGVYGMISRHLVTFPFTYGSLVWLNAHNMWGICVDNRFPTRGSGHQKFTCMRNPADRHALLGSLDISKTRWDTSDHPFESKLRNRALGKPTHDTGVLVRGPAVTDIERTFQERWDDPTRTFGLLSTVSVPPPLPKLGPPDQVPAIAEGTHSVQVLHTYGRATAFEAYSWSPKGEYTVWASYLNAIKKAATYIYIEDQYFLPFGWEPAFISKDEKVRNSDLIYQLGEAVARGVKVFALVPSNAEDNTHVYQKYQRDVGVFYLQTIARTSANGGDFVIGSLTNGKSDVYVHSKLMIVDDELVLIGSANIGRRSMLFDSEIQLAIVDGAGTFAANFRADLWAEHLQAPRDSVVDVAAGFALMKAGAATAGTGHLKAYPYELPGPTSLEHPYLINWVIEPDMPPR